jgi:RNA polymerase sigma factor FliA
MASEETIELKTAHPKDGRRSLKLAAVRAYCDQNASSLNNDRISQYLPMVSKIVHRVVTYLRPPLSSEDLISAGTVGLVKAARDYDPARRTDFKTYAYIRIRGAILDELRGWSFVPSNQNRDIREAFETSRRISQERGSPPYDDELAERLGVTIEALYKTFESARAQHFASIDENDERNTPLASLLRAAGTPKPDEQVERSELVRKLADAIAQLDERRRQIIILYYRQELTMKQIAEVFNITEPRVSQLHASALFSLSVRLKEWDDARQ